MAGLRGLISRVFLSEKKNDEEIDLENMTTARSVKFS